MALARSRRVGLAAAGVGMAGSMAKNSHHCPIRGRPCRGPSRGYGAGWSGFGEPWCGSGRRSEAERGFVGSAALPGCCCARSVGPSMARVGAVRHPWRTLRSTPTGRRVALGGCGASCRLRDVCGYTRPCRSDVSRDFHGVRNRPEIATYVAPYMKHSSAGRLLGGTVPEARPLASPDRDEPRYRRINPPDNRISRPAIPAADPSRRATPPPPPPGRR